MNMLVVPGGWYCESQPNGAYAVVVRGSHIDTHLGRIELCPGGDLLQLRLAADGIRFAGTGHNDGMAWEWTGSEWANHGPTFGNSACIYDASDMLNVVSRNVEPTWAQGWAFVDDHGQLVPGWVAYNPKDGLSAWTSHGSIAIGQGHDGGGVITAHGEHEIAKGEATWVRFNQSGDRIALAWIQQDHNEARLLWLTVAELVALPKVGTPAPVVTKPPVVPQPTPEPKPMAVPNKAAELAAYHQQYNGGKPISDEDEKRKFVGLFAGTLGPRFGWKSRSGPGQTIGKATLAYWLGDTIPTGPIDGKIDAFQLIGSNSQVSWDTRAEHGDPGYHNIDARFYPVGQTGTLEHNPAQTPTDLSAVLARLEALERNAIQYGAPIALSTDNGHFLCAEQGGGGLVNASRNAAGGWETFHVVKP